MLGIKELVLGYTTPKNISGKISRVRYLELLLQQFRV